MAVVLDCNVAYPIIDLNECLKRQLDSISARPQMAEGDVRTRIIEAAGPVFAQKGYDSATVREICRRAGVNVAAVNYYFGSKEQLYAETFARIHPAKRHGPLVLQWPPGTAPEEKLAGFVHTLLHRLLDRQTAAWEEQLLVRELLSPTPICRPIMREHFRSGFGQLDEILCELLPTEFPEYRRHQVALSIVAQCVYYRTARNVIGMIISPGELKAHFNTEELARHITRFSLAALGRLPPVAACPEANGGDGEVAVAQPEAQSAWQDGAEQGNR